MPIKSTIIIKISHYNVSPRVNDIGKFFALKPTRNHTGGVHKG